MNTPAGDTSSPRLRCAVALRVAEETCEVFVDEHVSAARFAPMMPTPRTERVSPGHLLALATAPDGSDVVVWRWYDAVVVGGDDDGAVQLWEPAHGEVRAQPRSPEQTYTPGARAYLSAGLPGADWWVAGPVVDRLELAEVELDEVARLYSTNDLWRAALEPA